MLPTVTSLDELVALVEQRSDLFIRWSRGRVVDAAPAEDWGPSSGRDPPHPAF